MGLNHIYKVIWSKTKNAWVVVSEIAKRDGKSSVKSVITSLAGKSVAAVMVAMVMCGGVASANTQYGVGADGGFDGTAIGENAKANSPRSTVIGKNAVASGSGDGSIVIGTNAFGMGYNTSPNSVIAIGNGARANTGSGGPTMAIGESAQAEATAGDAMAIGYNSKALGYNGGIAIGSNNSVYGNNLVLGKNSHINPNNGNDPFDSISIGNMNTLDGNEDSFVAGSQNHLIDNSGTNHNFSNILIGSKTTVNGTTNTVIGARYTNITGDYITAIGDVKRNATNWSNEQVVIGHNSAPESVASVSNSIGVGTTGKTLTLGTFAGSSPSLSVVSFGDSSLGGGAYTRQLKNVAAGVISPTSTDAINGSQLYRTIEALYSLGSPDVYMHVNDGTATQGAGNASTNLGKANEKGGATGNSSIAIGMHASAKKDVGVALGTGSVANDEGSVAIGSFYSTNASGVVSYSGANATGKNAISILGRTSGENAIAIGFNASPARNAIAMGFQTNANEMSIAIGANRNVAGTGSVAIGATTVGNNTTVEADDSLALLGGIQKKSTWGNNVKNSNAIGRGTFITSDNTTMIGSYDDNRFNQFSTDRTRYIAPRSKNIGMMTTYGEGTLENSVYLGHDSFAFTVNSDTDGESSSSGENSIHTKKYDATGNVVVSNNTTGGAFGKVSKATINGDEITGFAGSQSVGAVTIGAGDYERRIQNVAAGEVSATSTDGINGSQLYAVADTLSKNMSSYMHINDGTSTQTVGNATTNYGYSGSKAGATGNLAIAGGMNAKASGQQSLSLGSYTKSEGDYSVVIGSSHDTSWSGSRGQTFALGNYSVVLGRGAQTWKNNSIAIGHRTEVKGEDSIGIGKYVFTGGYSPVSTEMGSGITAVGTKLGVDGINTNVFGQGDINNIGGGSPILANDSTILGNRNGIVAIDSNDQQINPSSINDYATGSHILGNDSSAWGNNAIVIGNKSIAYRNSVALGYNAVALKNKSIAVGYGASARGEESISIGTGNNVEGAKSSAIGDPSYIDTTATGTHVQGNDNGTATNPIKASESTFMGNTNLAGTAGTTGIHVVGNNNTVDSSNVMVMGNGVTVGTGLDGAVVLGNASSADQYAAATDSTINGVTFEAAGYAGNTGLSNGSIVSVGATSAERQIKNVAAGAVTATSTDAVNGSQLYKTAETILKMPINMAGDSGDTVGLKLGKTVNIKGSVASGADVTDGNIAVVGDKATSTLSLKMAKNLTGLTSGTFTDATGNQTVINGAGVTVTPTGAGATPISITTSGINAGNQEIKGVKKGTTDDAAVNKKQMDDALAGISSTLTINDGTTDGSVNIKTGKLKVVGESGTNALVTTTVSGDTITVGTSTKLQNAVTAAEKSADKDLSNLSTTGSDKVKTLAQDAVKVTGTGLATVSDATAAGVKTYTVNVDEGKLVIDDTTGKVGAAGSTQGTTAGKNGVATTQDVASVVNSAIDKTKQALADAEHKFDGDTGTTSVRKHGEVLSIKGGVTTPADLTTGNIGVVSDGAGTLNVRLAKALTGLTSATYTDASGNTQTVTGGSSTISDAAGNSTVVSKGGVTTTDAAGNTTTTGPTGVTVTPAGTGATPISVTTSGISAGNKEIKNVANGTTDDAAVNKKQMDDALKGATDNTVSLGSESGSTTAKKLSTTGGIKFNIKGETGANALITTSATGDDVTIAPTAKLTAAVTAAENAANKDLSNLSTAGDTYIKNLAKSAASWNVETNGAGTTAVAGGDTVNFINGDNIAITNTGRAITIGTAKNVSFDKVTVGGTSGIVIDGTTKQIGGLAAATANDQAVNKGQMDTAIANAQTAATSTEKVVAKALTGDTNLATVTGQTGNAKGETYEVSVSENAVKAVAQTAAQDAVKVAGTGLATVSDATAAGVKTYTVNVDEGKLVIDDTTGKVGAAGSTQGTTQGKNGVATTQDVASVVNSAIDKTKQALDDAKHDFAGDDATVISRKHGEQLNIKGGASTTATDLTSGNIAVVGDTTTGTLNIKLAKVLTGLTSATYTDGAGNTQTVTGGSSTISDAAGNSTVVTKGGVTTTDAAGNTTTTAPTGVTVTPAGTGATPISVTTSGISAGNKEIKNVANGTTDDAAVNKKQMDDALKGATDNTVSLGSESGSTTAKKLSTTGGIKFNIKGETGANALITTSATGDDVTIAPTAKLTAAVTAAENAANKDLSNLSTAGDTYIKNLAKSAASWNVETNGAGTTAVAGGDTVNFINGDNIAITNTGRTITIGTAKNVSFDKVTVGGIVLDKNTGINAGGMEIKGVANATSADAAVNKGQLDAAVLSAAGGALSIEKVEAGSVVNGKLAAGDNNLASVSGLTGTAKNETYTVTVSENAVKAVAQTAAQDAVKVAGTGLATVSDATAAGVKTYTVNVDEGKLVIDDTTGKVGAAGSTQGTTQGKNGVATTQDVASVVNSAVDKTKQALDDAKHDFAGDDATVISRKHGEQLNIKGGASTTATDLTSGNIAVVGDTTTGTLNIKLAKALTGLTSATYTDASGNTQTVTGGSSTISDAAGNSTVVSKGGVTTTDAAGNTTTTAPTGVTVTPAGTGATPISVTTSGISAGNKEIKNVANGTTDDAAVNKKQMDDALKGATDNTVSLGSESGSTTAKKLSTTGGIKFNIKGETGANALITTSATGDDVTIAPTAKLTAAVTAAEKSADKDLSNISTAGETVIKNLAATSAQDAVKVSGTGLATVTDSTTGGVKTYNVDVKTGNLVVTAAGQVGATGTTGTGGATGADGVATTQNVASAINDAITKSKTDTAQAIADAEHKFDGDTGITSVRKHGEILSIKGGVTTPADLTTGNIGVVSDGAGTLNVRLAKVLSGLTSASFTNAGGDSTVINGNGVTITPSATGASSISMTTAGINAGNKEIKGVATGTTADAAVNKAQMDAAITAAAGGSLSTEKVVAKTLTGDNNLATVTGQTGNAKGETYEVSVSENAVKAVAQTAAQDAVKVAGTGLATVSDATAAGVKTYTVNVEEGKLVIDDTTGKVGAAGSTQGTTAGKNGVATTQDVASVVNSAIDKTKQALTDAKHDFAGDDATVISRKHGEQLNIKGGASTTATDLTSGNIAVVGDTTTGTLNIKLAKALTGLTSATYTDGAGNTQTVTGGSSTISDAAGNSTVVSKGGVTTTDAAGNTTTTAPTGVTVTPAGTGATPISVTTSGISAGNKEIKNVANGTTDDAAVNKKQMDDALKGATDNTVSLGSESGSTTAKKLSTTGGIKFNIKGETGANALITTSATGDDVTIAPTAKLTAAVTAAENAANKDLSNLNAAGDTYIKNLAKSAASWNVETNGAGTTAVAGGDTVNFINGDNIAITNTGRTITIGTAKNVSFDKVTVGGIVLDKNTGINAGGMEIKGVANATSADAAVNKGQLDAAVLSAAGGALSIEKVEAGSVANGKLAAGDNNLASVSGLTGTAKNETYTVTVSENAVKAVAQTAAQDAVKVAGTGLATVSDATAAGVKTYTVNVDEGKLVIDDTTGKVGAAGSTQGTTQGKNGVATTQDVASVVNSAIDKTKQALDDAKHDFAGDDATVISRKHGEQLNIKGGASTTATDLTSGNIAVVGDTTTGTLNIKLAKALTGLTSATYTDASGNTQTVTGGSSTISDAAGNSTVVTKGGVTTTDAAGNTTTTAPTGVTVIPAGTGATPISVTTSGISAGNKEIKNVANGTTDDAAVNKKQMDDALKGATDNTVSLGSESGSTTAKKLSTTGGIKFNIKGETGANALITTSATGDDVTVAPTAKLTAAVTAAENAANKDLSNLSTAGDTYIKNLAKSAASWNVETNGSGTTAVAGGDTVNFINGDNIAITNTGRSITIGTAKNVSFDKVTVGGIVLDKNTGINAGGKEIKGVANATSADAAVNKGQLDAAVLSAAGGALSIEKVEAGSVANGKLAAGDNNLASVSGLTGTAKNETYTVTVSENAVKAVAQTAAQDAVKVTGTGLATVSDATAAGVKTYTVNVEEGKLVIDDTTGKVGAAGSTQGTTAGKNGVATTQDVASVVNSAIDKTKQALDDAKHDFAGDDATVISRKHGEQLNIKGGASTTATDLTSGNIAVVGDTTTGTLNIKLAKVLTGLTSATYTDAAGNTQTVTGGSSTITDGAGNTTTITKGGMTTTDGTNTTTVAPAGVTATDGTNTVKLTGSGIDAGNTQIKNVGKATTDDAAVNKKQMDDAVKAATDSISTLGDNKVSLGSDSGTTNAKKLSTTGGIKFNIKGDTGANALITTSATGDDVTIAPTAKLTAAVTAAEKSADKDLSNLSTAGETVIKNLATTSAQDAVKVTGTGLATVTDSTTGGVKTYNVDVKTGNLVVTAAGQVGANGTTGAGGATGADGVATTQNVASAINDAITKSKTDTAQAIADAEHKFDGDTGTTSVRKHGEVLSIKGGVTTPADLTTGNIGVVSDGAGTLNVRLAKVLSGLTSASFTNAGGDSTVINGGGVTITPSATGATPISMTTAGINAGNKEIKGVATGTTADAAVNKAQMDAAITAAAGGSISTEKVVAKTLTGDNNLVTVTGQTGTPKGETYEVAVSENAVKAVAQTAAQDAVKVTGTGLATVTDSTTGGVKTYNVDVKTGNLVVTAAGQVGANGTTGAGGATGSDGVATTQNVASAINDAITKSKTDTAQAIADAEHKFDGDTGTTSVRKHGEVLSIKGGVTTPADLTTGNIGVVSDGAGTLNIRLAKVLSGLTSATYTDGAGNTQTVTSTSSIITDGAGNTTTITKGGVTSTDGTNTTTVAPSGVTATDGTNTVKLNGSGIDAGNTQIKNVGKATTDDAAVNKKQMDDAVKAATDSISTLGDNKVSLGSDSGTTTAKKLSTTGGIKFNIKGETGANALITTSATGDDVTIAPTAKLTAAVTAAEKSADKDLSNLSTAGETVIKNLAATSAQDAVKVTGTGLATVTDSTTGGVKTYNVDVKTGNLVVTAAGQAGATGTTGVGGAAGADGVATTQNVASAINDAITKSKTDTAQAIADAEHKFDGDTGATSVRKHGEVLSVKGGVTTPADLTTGNIGVVSDGAGTLNIRLAKVLSGLTSATYTDGAGNTQTVTGGSSTITDGTGNTTTITKGGMTTTDGTNTTTVAPSGVTATDGTNTVKLNGSGIDAGNTQIKNVGKATTDDAAVNKKQMDDAVKAATDSISTLGDNKVSLGSDSGTTTAKKLSTTGGIKFNIKGDTGANALITTSATGDDVTIAPTAKLSAAVTAAENAANKDLSNLSTAGNTYIQNLAKSAASWNVETNGGGTTAVAGGDTVNFINGDNIAITNTGRSITIGTARNVSFDKVTVGGVVIDKNTGIDAGGKEITNVGPATSGNSAVNKTQMDTAITNAVNKATTDAKHDFGGDDTTVVTRKHGEKLNIKGGASTTAADLTSGNIAVLGDNGTGTLNIKLAKVLTGLTSATFTTPGSGTTVINGGGMTITPASGSPISVTTGGINAGNTEIKNVAAGTTPNSAVNKQQMDNAISNATANVGFNTAGNTGTGSVSNGQTLTITGTNGIETNASGQSITVGLDAATRAQINNATMTANNAAKKDLSNIDNAGKQVIKDTAAWNVKVNSGTPEIVKGGDTVTFNDGDNIKVTNTGKDITIATKKDVSFDKVTVGNVVIDKNTNRISGLANAANNDEAVNLGQMNAAISTATAGTGSIKYKANGGTQNSVALTTGFDFKGDSNIQITADPANSGVINYKLNPALTGITSISGGTGAPTITLNAGSGSNPGNVSINSNLDMGGKQINNIGAATHAGDAVNKAQMDQALQTVASASSNVAKSYAYKAGAGAAALAALKPIQYDPLEPTQIMAGIGNYKSQTAVALGVAHYTNENTMFNLGVSLDSHDGMVNAGVTHKFGYSPEKKAIPDRYKGGPISSIYVMQDEMQALLVKDKEKEDIINKQASEIADLRQQNEDMKHKVEMILSKIH